MAKLNRKNIRGKGFKNLIHKKLFWILSAVAVLLIAAAIIIPIVVVNSNKTEEVKVDDYFGKTYKIDDREIKFKKSSNAGVHMYSNLYEDSYLFVFALDLSKFYPETLKDKDGNELKDDTHERIFNMIKSLQEEIDIYNETSNEEDTKAYLLIVDTTPNANSDNGNIYDDFGTVTEDINPLFFVYNSIESEVKKTYKKTETSPEKTIYGETYSALNGTVISDAIEFVKNGFKEYIEK